MVSYSSSRHGSVSGTADTCSLTRASSIKASLLLLLPDAADDDGAAAWRCTVGIDTSLAASSALMRPLRFDADVAVPVVDAFCFNLLVPVDDNEAAAPPLVVLPIRRRLFRVPLFLGW